MVLDYLGIHVTVYVDDMKIPYRRMLMCHMMADTLEELEAMANRIGIKWEHEHDYHLNICQTKRNLAIKYGAVSITRREMVKFRRKVYEVGSRL